MEKKNERGKRKNTKRLNMSKARLHKRAGEGEWGIGRAPLHPFHFWT
jgi:hypothetical protein